MIEEILLLQEVYGTEGTVNERELSLCLILLSMDVSVWRPPLSIFPPKTSHCDLWPRWLSKKIEKFKEGTFGLECVRCQRKQTQKSFEWYRRLMDSNTHTTRLFWCLTLLLLLFFIKMNMRLMWETSSKVHYGTLLVWTDRPTDWLMFLCSFSRWHHCVYCKQDFLHR